ncbi:hypothetical protein [Deinococcus planocerae]|uniref:hypothetical protein n=1 Tax=Deinococcus planocerae TaxID=1737569 RepID=UPI000C7F4C40|nr:hypothetical protein [Deinococcus planocerae]
MRLRDLIRPQGQSDPTNDEDSQARERFRDAARRLAEGVRQNPRVQEAAAELRGRAEELRETARARADGHLERLIESRAGRGEALPDEVAALLERRRREHEAQAARRWARQELLALAETPEQRRVLGLVAGATLWAGGTEAELRYTTLLDRLAPSGEAQAEMDIHRALWTLAERRVLAVSPHGVVTACPLPETVTVRDETRQADQEG